MKVLLVLAVLVTLTTAQLHWLKHYFTQRDYVLDYMHSYRFEEHVMKKQKILVAIRDNKLKTCHVMEIGDDLDKYLHNWDNIERITEEIYHLIKNSQVGKPMTRAELYHAFKDKNLPTECFRHKTYLLAYTPSFELTTPTSFMSTTPAN